MLSASQIYSSSLKCLLAVGLMVGFIGFFGAPASHAQKALLNKAPAKKTSLQAWTLEEVREQLSLNSHDTYLQFVALQLAQSNAANLKEVEDQIGRVRAQTTLMNSRGRTADLFDMFTGALAVQESLQLDTMRGERPPRGPQKIVKAADLRGPTIKSHPWDSMLKGQSPAVSSLSKLVPADQYFVQTRSLTKLLELIETGDLWSMHLFNQATHDATRSRVGDRLREQIAVRSDPLMRPFYDLVVERVAVTGSDLYVREGSDVTLLFQVKQPAVFAARMNGFLNEAEEHHPNAKRTTGKFLNVDYVHLATPDRKLHVFSAYPRPDLHVRSNSRVGLERVLSSIAGNDRDGAKVERLGETSEFKYIRTLMKEDAAEEDAFIYLSDAFIRHMVGPQLKLTERRRLLAFNHTRMISHAALLHRTQYGKPAASVDELVKADCLPKAFVSDQNKILASQQLDRPFDSRYSLTADGQSGFCTVTGSSSDMIPCCEIPLVNITQQEADEYQAFLEQYNSYWRTFFDPIAIRVKIDPKKYRIETIILPLIDNTIYTQFAQALGGEPEPLDELPLPKGNIFSMVMKLDPKSKRLGSGLLNGVADAGVGYRRTDADNKTIEKFIKSGLGDQIGFHVYDASQLLDVNMSQLFGGMFNTPGAGLIRGGDGLWIGMMLSSLNSPVYISMNVKDEKVVDDFLLLVDRLMAAQSRQPTNTGWFSTQTDFYRIENEANGKQAADDATAVRGYAVALGPFKWRFFSARIGKALYVASKKHVIEDLVEATRQQVAQAGKGDAKTATTAKRWQPTAHAMIRIRPENWKHVLPDFQLGWAENNRRAVINNLSLLSAVARAAVAAEPELLKQNSATAMKSILRQAETTHGVEFLSPDGGEYVLAADGCSVSHSLYGSALEPRQPARLAADGEVSALMEQFAGATAELTFLEDGLHAVLTLEKK